MLAEYRIRREARLLVANRLTAVANDTIMSSMPTAATVTTTITTSAPTASAQAPIEYTIPADVRTTVGPMQATNPVRQATPQSELTVRSVETQTLTKLQQPFVSFSLGGASERKPPLSSAASASRQTAQSTIITPAGGALDTDNDANPIGCYTNWSKTHADIAAAAWCCIGDLMAFCDKYEFRALGVHDTKAHQTIVMEVKSLLAGVSQAPFDVRRRFPANIRNAENLWVCIDRCPSVEYHLKRMLSIFRRPLASLSIDKQRAAVQTFHLAINELRLDISARISEVHLYDRAIFEREFHLSWSDTPRAMPPPTTQTATVATTTPIPSATVTTKATASASATTASSQMSYRRLAHY